MFLSFGSSFDSSALSETCPVVKIEERNTVATLPGLDIDWKVDG